MSIKVFNHALELIEAGPAKWPEAETVLRQGLRRDPKQPELNDMLGTVLVKLGKLEQAEYYHNLALSISPNRSEFLNNFGGLRMAQERWPEARAAFEKAIAINPSEIMAYQGLAKTAVKLHDFELCIRAALRAAEMQPDSQEQWVNVSMGYLMAGMPREGAAALRRGAQLAPGRVGPMYLGSLLYHPDLHPGAVLAEHESFGRAVAGLIPAENRPWKFDPDAGTGASGAAKLRVGYMSSDLRRHSVAMFIEPLLRGHDRTRFHITAYHNSRDDHVSARLKPLVDAWVNITDLSHDQVLTKVRGDGINILVDLNGYTIGSRVDVLARRGAPVQINYLGYPAKLVLPTMDARIIDAVTDPAPAPGESDGPGEQLVRLDRCFLAFAGEPGAPPVGPPAAARTGRVTFGSFNAMAKVNDRTLSLWARVLHAVPGSRLLLKNSSLADPAVAQRLRSAMAGLGIDSTRVELLAWAKELKDHLLIYNDVDIALDCTPYNGTTTTCEAMHMGVPTVTLRGFSHVSRVGASILGAAGLTELIADDEPSYVRIAQLLAQDLPRLTALRAELRERMARSALGDGPGLARAIEAAYLQLWQQRCAQAKAQA